MRYGHKTRQTKEEKGKVQIKKTDRNCGRKTSKVYKPGYQVKVYSYIFCDVAILKLLF